MRFFFQFSWIFYSKINIVIITVKTRTLVDFLHVKYTDSMPYWYHSKYVRRNEYILTAPPHLGPLNSVKKSAKSKNTVGGVDDGVLFVSFCGFFYT